MKLQNNSIMNRLADYKCQKKIIGFQQLSISFQLIFQ